MNNEKLSGDLSEERTRIWKLIENSKFVNSALDQEGFEYYYQRTLNELRKQIFFEEDGECSNL